MNDRFYTLKAPSEAIYRVKGSKFIGFAFPVFSESEIKEHLDELHKKYFDATHHCYAWALRANRQKHRENDDGEPSGSAGRPIYGQILSADLSNILIVVVRYFGGTKLGVSGLIDAYKNAAKASIEEGTIIEKFEEDLVKIDFSYHEMNVVMKFLKDRDLTVLQPQFDLRCSLQTACRKSQSPELISALNEIEGVSAEILLF
jgi:uncharacterized YigZ family protein